MFEPGVEPHNEYHVLPAVSSAFGDDNRIDMPCVDGCDQLLDSDATSDIADVFVELPCVDPCDQPPFGAYHANARKL